MVRQHHPLEGLDFEHTPGGKTWCAVVMESQRAGHDLVTQQQGWNIAIIHRTNFLMCEKMWSKI